MPRRQRGQPEVDRLAADYAERLAPAIDRVWQDEIADLRRDLEIWVQSTTGGNPVRLTHHAADDHEPAFSPDSTRIAFRSERNGGGIFVVPTTGGEVRQIAQHGRNPRFSPNGASIAYWEGSAGGG